MLVLCGIACADERVIKTENDTASATLTLASDSLRLSETLTVKLSVDAPREATIIWPTKQSFETDWLVQTYREYLPMISAKGERRELSLVLRPRRNGTLTIGPVAIEIIQKETASATTLAFAATPVRVAASVAAPSSTLPEWKTEGPIDVPATWPWQYWAALLCAAGAVIAAVAWLAKQHAPATILVSARDRALTALDKLSRDTTLRADPKSFVSQVTHIVRRWIEETTGVRAPEQTTEEFLATLERRPVFPAECRERLRQFLQAADLVKFAGVVPADESLGNSIDTARALVQRWSSIAIAAHTNSPLEGRAA